MNTALKMIDENTVAEGNNSVMYRLNVATKRGVVLNGVLFSGKGEQKADMVQFHNRR